MLITGAFHLDGGIPAVNRLVIKAIVDEGYPLEILSLVETDAALDERYLPPGARVTCHAFAGNKVAFTLVDIDSLGGGYSSFRGQWWP